MKALVGFVTVLSLQSIAAEKKEEVVPKISDSHLAEYYRTESATIRLQATIKEVQEALKTSQADMKVAVEVIQKDCGEKYVPSQTDPKTIACVIKPPAEKSSEKK